MMQAHCKNSYTTTTIGPSGLRALPLAAGRNKGGHYFSYILVRAECVRCPWLLAETKVATILGIFSHFWAPPLFKTPEGLVVGIQIFAWATTKYK